jgi:Subtilase family/PKD domain/PA domain
MLGIGWRRRCALLVVVLGVLGCVGSPPARGAADTEVVRVVVQLEDPPLAKYRDTLPDVQGVREARTADGHLDVKDPASREYLSRVASEQGDFEARLAQAVPAAEIHWRYRVAFNGLAIEVPRPQLEDVRHLRGVASVTETYDVEPELDESRSLIGLPQLWQSLPRNGLGAGVGARVALIDAGVNATHPFFNPAGFSSPAGYPKAQRVAGGVRTNLPLESYANNKVIVGNVYAYPGDTTALPWGQGSRHGTHVAGIMAGVEGTYDFTSGPATFPLHFSGIAPGAYVMSYRLWGDTAEFLAAIEDVVADQADALNISLGHSYWLTTDPDHDPVRKALDAAVDAGVVVVGSSGNAGANGDSNNTGSWKLSPKVITVANSSHGRIFSNAVSVTGPETPPAALVGRPGVAAAAPAPPIGSTITGEYAVAPGGSAGSAGEACTELPAGSMTGKIALVARGTCTFDVKKAVVMAAGAKAWIVHNNAPDAPIAMAALTAPAIAGVMVTLADGRALVAWAAANPVPTVDIEGPLKRLTSGWPDVVAGSSSRGPGPNLELKPDITAPGTSILSSVVNDTTGAVAAPLFDLISGTSMAAPHIAALAALTEVRHPGWNPAQIKSALMNTASTEVWTDIDHQVPARVKDRGAGRVDAARLVDPQLTFAPPSASFGLMRPTERHRLTVSAQDMRTRGRGTRYAVNVRQVVGHPAVRVAPERTFTTHDGEREKLDLELSTAGAPAGDYEGFIEVSGGGQTYTIPYFVRVRDPQLVKDVLLIDWDRNLGDVDHRPAYTAALTGLGLSFDVFDGGTSAAANGNPGPTYAQLQGYRAIVLFTGDNAASWSTAHVGGSFPVQDFLVAGGRLIMSGQDLNTQFLYNQNTGSDYLFGLMSGWLTGAERNPATCEATRSDANFYGTPATTAQLETAFTLFGRIGDVSVNVGGSGANNQRRPDAGRLVTGADAMDACTYIYSAPAVSQHARVLGRYTVTKLDNTAIARLTDAAAIGVAPDPTLMQPEPQVNWTAAILHVGAEGLNANRGELSLQSALGQLHDFVADRVSVSLSHKARGHRVDFFATAQSVRESSITSYHWDFGDGSPVVETTQPRVAHDYGWDARRRYTARVEAVDALTRTSVGATSVKIR